MYLLCLFCYDCLICFSVFLPCVTDFWLNPLRSMWQFCKANPLFKSCYYFWNVQFFAAYWLAIHIARHRSSWRWEGNTPGIWLWDSLRNLILVVEIVTGPSSVKMSEGENWCQVSSWSPYWQKACSCELCNALGKCLGLNMQTIY